MNVTRFVRNASAAAVAAIAGYASYWHQVDVAIEAGERSELAHVLPLSVDGLLIVSSIAMVDARQQGRHPHWMTRVGFAMGILASVGANVAAAQPTMLGRMVAAWPALALLLVVEMLSRKGRLLPVEQPTVAVPAAAVPVQQQTRLVEDRAAAVVPVPVAPGIRTKDRPVRGRPSGSGPVARRAAVSPLTGNVLSEEAPRV